MVPDQRATQAALSRALRRMLTESSGGSMQSDFGRAVVDAVRDVLDRQPRVFTLEDLDCQMGLVLSAGSLADDAALQIPLDDRETAAAAVASTLADEDAVTTVLEFAAERCWCKDFSDDGSVTTYEFTVDDRVYSFVHNETLKIGRSMWRFERTVDDAATQPRASEPSTGDGPSVLARMIGQMLRDADSGSLPGDLARAIVDAWNEVLDHAVPEREISLVELNAMFLLDLGDHFTDEQKRCYTIPIDDPKEGPWAVGDLLVADEHFEDVLGIVTTGPCSMIDASPEGSVGVYEFTVDDGVYYFACGDMEAQTPEWWFGHSVNDDDARDQARGVGPRELWDMDLWEQEQASG